jgi:hypothetical protein
VFTNGRPVHVPRRGCGAARQVSGDAPPGPHDYGIGVEGGTVLRAPPVIVVENRRFTKVALILAGLGIGAMVYWAITHATHRHSPQSDESGPDETTYE